MVIWRHALRSEHCRWVSAIAGSDNHGAHVPLRDQNILQSRAFVLSRSLFAGGGKFAAHWTGDNDSTFKSMKGSIPDLLSMSLFGISFAGEALLMV